MDFCIGQRYTVGVVCGVQLKDWKRAKDLMMMMLLLMSKYVVIIGGIVVGEIMLMLGLV